MSRSRPGWNAPQSVLGVWILPEGADHPRILGCSGITTARQAGQSVDSPSTNAAFRLNDPRFLGVPELECTLEHSGRLIFAQHPVMDGTQDLHQHISMIEVMCADHR